MEPDRLKGLRELADRLIKHRETERLLTSLIGKKRRVIKPSGEKGIPINVKNANELVEDVVQKLRHLKVGRSVKVLEFRSMTKAQKYLDELLEIIRAEVLKMEAASPVDSSSDTGEAPLTSAE